MKIIPTTLVCSLSMGVSVTMIHSIKSNPRLKIRHGFAGEQWMAWMGSDQDNRLILEIKGKLFMCFLVLERYF